MKDENGQPCNRFDRGMFANIMEFYQVYPEYLIDYRSVFELPRTFMRDGQMVSVAARAYDDMRYETGSSHSSQSGYSDADSRSRSSSLTSV
jgi:hypothetical protein